jgi:hypothetical protein
MDIPLLVASDSQGNIFEIPHLSMAGAALTENILPHEEDLIPLPRGSDFFMLPGRTPVGYDVRTGRFTAIRTYRGVKINAVAAFMSSIYFPPTQAPRTLRVFPFTVILR